MNWLNELQRDTVYKYTNRETGDTLAGTKEILEKHFNQKLKCENEEEVNTESGIYRYSGFEPHKLGMMLKTTFEKNGRKAVRIKHADGSQAVRSATKDNWMRGKGTESVLTKGCREASNKVKKELVHKKFNEWTKGGTK